MTKCPASIRIVGRGVTHVAYFNSVDEAKAILEELAVRLAKIKEYSNRDEDPIFRFAGAGAFYVVDLRHIQGGSVEVLDEWAAVQRESSLRQLDQRRTTRTKATEAGLGDELERVERQIGSLPRDE